MIHSPVEGKDDQANAVTPLKHAGAAVEPFAGSRWLLISRERAYAEAQLRQR
ncbi:hypothetical protein [Burkholderia sp. Leaf177]|uniref:hypothetical protein n=1 Tax=Burkholderia sp. Leaf177 TaxID=1736287 RepID=UPI0012E3EFB5|nr:hypothetical protein [Burkholderia sp. Leaf177]